MVENDYSPPAYAEDLRAIAAKSSDDREIIAQVRPLALRLAANTAWLKPEYYVCDEEQGFGVHLLHEEADHSLAVFALSWLPGRGTPPHDHGTWAVVAGIDGDERNVNWQRNDDGSRPGYAEIEAFHELMAGPGDVLAFLPKDIHSVENPGDKVSLSLHTYGRHINHTGRSEFDAEARTEKPFIVATS